MKRNSILFVGCGDLGIRAGSSLLENGWEVAGVRRDPTQLPAGFRGFAADYAVPGSLDFIAALKPDYLVASFNPSDRSEEGYRRGFAAAAKNLVAGMGAHRPRALLMISSTRVFAERAGGWVDEGSPLAADDARALAIIAAERELIAARRHTCIVRFAGIYGAPEGRLLRKVRRGELSPAEPRRYSNRIHRDDCAGFLLHLLERAQAGRELAPVYIGVDDLPAPQAEVERWLAAELGLSATVAQAPSETASPGGNGFQVGHKRCSNRLLRSTGYELRYPDYRSGYRAVLAAQK